MMRFGWSLLLFAIGCGPGSPKADLKPSTDVEPVDPQRQPPAQLEDWNTTFEVTALSPGSWTLDWVGSRLLKLDHNSDDLFAFIQPRYGISGEQLRALVEAGHGNQEAMDFSPIVEQQRGENLWIERSWKTIADDGFSLYSRVMGALTPSGNAFIFTITNKSFMREEGAALAEDLRNSLKAEPPQLDRAQMDMLRGRWTEISFDEDGREVPTGSIFEFGEGDTFTFGDIAGRYVVIRGTLHAYDTAPRSHRVFKLEWDTEALLSLDGYWFRRQ